MTCANHSRYPQLRYMILTDTEEATSSNLVTPTINKQVNHING